MPGTIAQEPYLAPRPLQAGFQQRGFYLQFGSHFRGAASSEHLQGDRPGQGLDRGLWVPSSTCLLPPWEIAPVTSGSKRPPGTFFTGWGRLGHGCTPYRPRGPPRETRGNGQHRQLCIPSFPTSWEASFWSPAPAPNPAIRAAVNQALSSTWGALLLHKAGRGWEHTLPLDQPSNPSRIWYQPAPGFFGRCPSAPPFSQIPWALGKSLGYPPRAGLTTPGLVPGHMGPVSCSFGHNHGRLTDVLCQPGTVCINMAGRSSDL